MSNIGRRVKIVRGFKSDNTEHDTTKYVGCVGEIIMNTTGSDMITKFGDGQKKRVTNPDDEYNKYDPEAVWTDEPVYMKSDPFIEYLDSRIVALEDSHNNCKQMEGIATDQNEKDAMNMTAAEVWSIRYEVVNIKEQYLKINGI